MSFYEYIDYRDLVAFLLESKIGRGSKVKLAEVLNCNPGYISQVLNKTKIHFNAENVIKISHFLMLEPIEEEFLMALLHLERSGSVELKNYWLNKIKIIRNHQSKVEKQVKKVSQDLSESAQAIYYSHWAYSAIHMIVSIDDFKSSQEISKRLKVSNQLTAKILAFLEEHNLITKDKNIYRIGKTRIHLKSESPLVKSHHQNFRNKAIISLEEDNDFDLHYSAVLTLSKKDSLKIRQLLLKFIREKEEILLPSANEDIIGLNLDLFKF
jgi:uncharacterized protein (TIGR02147 family)